MPGKIIIQAKGKPKLGDFDKSVYSDDHDVPAIFIGDQIVALGEGIGDWGEKYDDHLRWKLDPEKEYIVEIREAESSEDAHKEELAVAPF